MPPGTTIESAVDAFQPLAESEGTRIDLRGETDPIVALDSAALRQIVTDGGRPEVVHAHEYAAGPLAFGLAGVVRSPVIVSEHWSGFALGTVRARERQRAAIGIWHRSRPGSCRSLKT